MSVKRYTINMLRNVPFDKLRANGLVQRFPNLTVSQSDQGMQCKAKSGEKAEFT